MKIPFFNYPFLFKSSEEELINIFKDVCERGAYILQKDVINFENNLKTFLDVKHVISVANGTDALLLALRAAGIKQGDAVILPSHTYIATAASVQLLGAKPILADCQEDHMLDPESVLEKLKKHDNVKAIMPVQVNGRTCDMDKLCAIAQDNQLLIIEDAAQGLGSKFKGRCAGTFGLAGTFSFYPAKTLGCLGDGGAVVTNNDYVAEQIRLLRDHGRNEQGEVVLWGFNSRLDNLQAAILDYKLQFLHRDIARRREIASLYYNGLHKLKDLDLPPPPSENSDHFDAFQNYEIKANHRDELRTFLLSRGISTLIQWGGTPVHQFTRLGFDEHLPKTDALFQRCMMLPMNVSLTDQEVAYIVESIQKFYVNQMVLEKV